MKLKTHILICTLLFTVRAAASATMGDFDNRYPQNPESPRKGWSPIFSFFLPGLDQFWEGQTTAGVTYAGYALAGLNLASAVSKGEDNPGQDDIDSRDNRSRQMQLGLQMYQTAGALSAYQAYRSTIQVYRDAGNGYQFIKTDDTALDLVTAPFDFRYLARPTTYIPLGGLLIATVVGLNNTGDADRYIDGSDIGYASGMSYQAGVSEEALFRGWLMPGLRQSWGSDVWSNATQATLFGAAHISSDNPFPLPQAIVGFYFGWLTQQNGWSVRENAFIHMWWDVIAFTTGYLTDSKSKRQNILPLISGTW